ncbi:MAG: alpha/beta fold hydrolase [Nanoarchaeota archaeon]
MRRKVLFFTLLTLTLLLIASCESQEKKKSGFIQPPGINGEPGTGQVCTQEAKICADGTSVGRTGSNCEFTPCPDEMTSAYSTQNLILETTDHVILTGTLYSTSGNKAVILLHMLGKNRQSWEGFANALHQLGYNVLAIDLRGHGESILKNNGRIQFSAFSNQDYMDMTYDVAAAVHYFKNKVVYIAGASIGANLALKYAAQDPSIQKIILLSPGLGYHGVNVEQDNMKYTGKMLIVTSKDDAYSAESSSILNRKSPGEVKLKIYEAAGHGNSMFTAQPELTGLLIDWMNQP